MMKQLLTLAGVLLTLCGSAQTATVNYTASTAVISNPERGFYKYSDTHSSSYDVLNQTTLINYRLNQNISIIFRYYYLETFKTSPISASYLSNMQIDFDRLRNAGLKVVMRFAYGDDEGDSPRDASKTQILAHINQIKPLLEANSDVILALQAGFIGTWGEWYYTSQAEFGGYGYNETSLTPANKANRKAVVDALLDALPANRMVQLRTPIMKRDMYGTAPVSNAQAFNESDVARLGHHNDCFLASEDDYGTYEQPNIDFPYLMQDSKFTPVGGETCAVNSPRSDCATAIEELGKFHWSWLNADYHPGVLANFTEDGCMAEIQKKLGYRFELQSGTFPTAATAGNNIAITLKVKNVGFATPFNERKAYLVLKNTVTNQVFPIELATNPGLWFGPNDVTINETIALPSNLAEGSYKFYLHLPDAAPALAPRAEYAIRLANESTWENTTGYNNLNHTMTVSTALGTAENTRLNLAVYPVPTSEQLTVEMEGIQDFKAAVFNAVGQSVKVTTRNEANKVIFETSGLSDGLYFVEFTKDNIRDVRKFVVRH
ncbi:DUF4832 domain-containing protein [Flavobacterium caeni]|uniref:Por secretion system C-terminal sorting domain-containing protein n=1 Tax=Flavobacterium caeni TaxID=490189 RepID=A0A1G5DA44_9FLAO|nr:DUF4832 domain-containing protein [Flavobacterium caeni]SCY11486.1 Por secretion system C-terminal sorting domain-containing protein [Flavobacterium caeni]